MRHLESPCHEFWNSETEIWCASSFLYMTMDMTKCLCIKRFCDFAFREAGDEASWLSKLRSPKPRNGAYLNWLLPFSWSPTVTIGYAKKALHISWVYKLHRVWSTIEISIDPTVQILSRPRISWVSTPCSVDSKSATCLMIRRFKSDLDSTAQIISWFHISRFRCSFGYVSFLSKSRFVKLRNGVRSIVQIIHWSDGCD